MTKGYFILCLVVSTITYVAIYFNFCKNTVLSSPPKLRTEYLAKCRKVEALLAANYSIREAAELRRAVKELNNGYEVLNRHYGPVLPDTPVVVVRARRHRPHLLALVRSLARVPDIHTVLLVFSHSCYDPDINTLVRQIDFCMVLQIYFLSSLQLHPSVFPGRVIRSTWSERHSAEDKHHWWWTAHVVFTRLPWAQARKAMVVFVEEDSVLLPDCLYMLRAAMSSLRHVPDADVISLGGEVAAARDYGALAVNGWRPLYHRGLVFNRTIWKKIIQLQEYYCQYDDASWSASLLHLFGKLPRGYAVAVTCAVPRVVPAMEIHGGRDEHDHQLFPKRVRVEMLFGYRKRFVERPRAPPRGNGGWSDVHDHLLCFDPLMATTDKEESSTNH